MLLPERNDSRIVAHASRSFYRSLLTAGVELLEYRGGFLHAKTLLADDALIVFGSANMDRRSFDLNYENNLLVSDPDFAAALAVRRAEWLVACRPVTLDEVRRWGPLKRVMNNVHVLFAPLI